MAILAELTSDDVLDTAYDWLCRRRRAYPADADVWSFRQAWAQEKDKLKQFEPNEISQGIGEGQNFGGQSAF